MTDRGSIVRKLNRHSLLTGIRDFQIDTHYEVIMGSFAYGVTSDTSDCDVYGVYTPPMGQVFPHTTGYIYGFGKLPHKDETYQKHHIQLNEKEYDVALYSIVFYFSLCMDNNPNMIDSLFVPRRCIVHSDEIGDALRENRRLFLHKGIHKKLMGYAYSQLKKLKNKQDTPNLKKLNNFEVKIGISDVISINDIKEELYRRGIDLEKLEK